MSATPMDFKITPPKVKPQRGISLMILIIRPVVCILGPSIVPLIVYLMEGCTHLFFWMLGFGSLICVFLLINDLGKVKGVIQYLKSCCETICKKKLLLIPSYNKNLPPLKLSSVANNSGPQHRQILDGFDLLQPTTASTVVEMPISLDCSSSSSLSGVSVSLQSPIFTPTKRRVISAASVSLEPLKNETETFAMTSPFSKRRLGFPGCISPRHLGFKDSSHLSTILESPYADCNVDSLQPRRPSCFSS